MSIVDILSRKSVKEWMKKEPVKQDEGNLEMIARLNAELDELERKARATEEKYRMAFNSSPVLMALSTLEEGCFINVNNAFAKMVGAKKEDIEGKTSIELGILTPEVRENLVDEVCKNGWVCNKEITFRSLDGEEHQALISSGVLHIDNKPYMHSVLVDITEMKKVQEKLERTCDFLRAMLETLPTPLFVKNNKGQYTEVNKAFLKLVGKEKSEVLGKTPEELGFQEFALECTKTDTIVKDGGGKTRTFYCCLETPKGQKDLLTIKTGYKGQGKEPLGIIGTVCVLSDVGKHLKQADPETEFKYTIEKGKEQ